MPYDRNRAKSKQPIFYVYVYLDTRKPGYYRYGHWVFHFEPFYVGKGHGKRYHDHLNQVISGKHCNTNKHKSRIIAKILRETNENPKIRIVRKFLTEKEAFALEEFLINKIGRTQLKTGPLTNKTSGGDGSSGMVFSKKQKNAVRLGHARRTKEQKEETNALRLFRHNSKSEEEKISIVEKRIKTLNSRTERQKKKSNKKKSDAYHSKTQEEKLAYRALLSQKQKERWANMSEEEKERIVQKRVSTHFSKSPEELIELSLKLSSSQKLAKSLVPEKKKKETVKKWRKSFSTTMNNKL